MKTYSLFVDSRKRVPVTEGAKLYIASADLEKTMIRYVMSLRDKLIQYGLFGALLLGSGAAAYSQQAKQGGNLSKDGVYVIQPNDTLEIFVWKEPELTRKVLVRPDGRISFPLVQDLKAAGISPGELKGTIELKLKEFLTSPNVTVIVDNIQSYKVFVVGKVQKPGGIAAQEPISVLQALSMAGGFQDYAKQSNITILRHTNGQNFVLPFDYPNVTRGRKPDENVLLHSGDVVVVP